MTTTNISWADKTWNPVVGCSRVSEWCDHDALLKPLAWKKPCVCSVNSVGDVFHEKVPFEFLDKMYAVMAMCPHITFKVLPKRTERTEEYLRNLRLCRKRWSTVLETLCPERSKATCYSLENHYQEPLPNVIHGVSIENQEQADARIPHLLRVPGRRFLSLEPLLGPVDLEEFLWTMNDGRRHGRTNGIHGVVVGGESGPGARPFDVLWAESLLKQCRDAGVPFHLKQLGSNPVRTHAGEWDGHRNDGWRVSKIKLKSKNGSNMAEWPEHLRVREEVGGT